MSKVRKITNSDFCHLHNHTEYSAFDGLNKIKEFPLAARKKGFKALAMTDHGNIGGAIKFMQECLKPANDENGNEIPTCKPIIGAEFYFAKNRHHHSTKEQTDKRKGNRHLVLIAKNWTGYQNLCRLSEHSWSEGYFFDPRIDIDLLSKYHDGLICTSACLSSVINANLLHDRYDQAKKAVSLFKDLFGKDFHLEAMYHGIDAEGMIIPDILKLGKDMDVQVHATNDTHYCEKCQGESQEILMAMSTSRCMNDPSRLSFPYKEFYLKSAQEMSKIFGSHPELLTNTMDVADKINTNDILTNMTSGMRLPRYDIPKNFDSPHDYLTHLSYEGLKKLEWDQSPEHVARLELELGDVKVAWDNNKYDFATYFLIVRDYMDEARRRDILTGCGRGCLSPDTLVYMATGEATPISEIKETEMVVDRFGNSGMVISTHEYECYEKMLRIRTYQGDHQGICLTKDHKVLIEKCSLIQKNLHNHHLKKYAFPTGNLEWVPAQDLKIDDWMFIPFLKTSESNNAMEYVDLYEFADSENLVLVGDYIEEQRFFPQNKVLRSTKSIDKTLSIDHNLMWILGKFIADGWIRQGYMKENAIYFSFHASETEQINTIKQYFENIGCETHISKHKTKLVIQMAIKSILIWKLFDSWLPEYSQSSQTKYIPDFVFDLDRDLKIAIIQGLFAGDGHCNRSARKFLYTTVSKKLAYQLRFLLLELGIPCSVSKESRGDNYSVRTLMHGAIDCGKNGYCDKYDDSILSSRLKMSHISEKGIFTKIRSIEEVESTGKVYDLTVDSDSSYLTTSGIVHNSGFSSVLLRCLGISYGPDPLEYGLLWERFLGFDTKKFLQESDFGLDDAKSAEEVFLEAAEADREFEEDMGGVDRY